ncbi:hypothetical protein AAFF_G00356730 [Aldrovandia affinis]|uniref:Uncharacterized protein n=1 Tax=Aldrovandia affinis TaxID=143900 RepID=A0AAD7X134_9TELE|nr:hypothetical protein AAFF_G00356730 [Aldrovandia affinis]
MGSDMHGLAEDSQGWREKPTLILDPQVSVFWTAGGAHRLLAPWQPMPILFSGPGSIAVFSQWEDSGSSAMGRGHSEDNAMLSEQ